MITETASKTICSADDQAQVDAIVNAGPKGALALAGTAVALVLLMWLGFYCLVFLPRT